MVVATTKSTNKNIGGENNTEFTMISDDNGTEEQGLPAEDESQNGSEEASDKKEETSEDANRVEIGKISSNVVSDVTITNNEASVASAPSSSDSDNSLPSTGPEDLLPLALVSGMLVTYLLSRSLAKE